MYYSLMRLMRNYYCLLRFYSYDEMVLLEVRLNSPRFLPLDTKYHHEYKQMH